MECISVLSRLFLGGGGYEWNASSVLSRLLLGGFIVQIYPLSVSEAAAPPIRMMSCKAHLYSIIVTKQLYTCKYAATDCATVTLAQYRGWIQD